MSHQGDCISQETYDLLVCGQRRGTGPATLRKLIVPRLKSADNTPPTDDPPPESVERADSILNDCVENGITVVSPLDASYPPALSAISTYPPLLYIKGSVTTLSYPSVAVVGTRNATTLGAQLAHRISMAIGKYGFTVTSGLALGIDTSAHRGALDAPGRTIAVLAHGLDTVTPASNRGLAEEIVESGGALVSEHPPGTRAYPPEFVRRNRIQSGMSFASIIVESGKEGGAIHQARFTREQERALFVAWPNAWTDRRKFNSEGAEYLMRECGANRLTDSGQLASLLDEYHTQATGQTLDLFPE